MRNGWLIGIVGLVGCSSLWDGYREARDHGDMGPPSITTYLSTTPQKDVDILFLIDNSPSMTPKQEALAQIIPSFIQKIDSFGADYHLGVATSDVGSTAAPGTSWSPPLGSCDTYEGDDGTLQRMACTTRIGTPGITPQFVTACSALCPDPSKVPRAPDGFIAKVNGITNVPGDDVKGAFQCIALVGDAGCIIEGQLEGVKRALDGHNPMNAHFLRPNSVLAVIIFTDEDDCSVQIRRRSENDSSTTDCPTPDKNAAFNCFSPDFRCVARDNLCNEPMNVAGAKTNCAENPDSYLEPISTYVQFINGLRPSKGKLLVSGIWTPKNSPFNVSSNGAGPKSSDLNRASGAGAGCVNVNDPNLFGQVQFRLSRFAGQVRDSTEISICDVDHYAMALSIIADKIQARLSGNCLGGVPRTGGSGMPLCLVGDVDQARPDATPAMPLAECSAGCCNGWASSLTPVATDPTVMAACMGEIQTCYCAVPSTVGRCTPNDVITGVWPVGPIPQGQIVKFQCQVE